MNITHSGMNTYSNPSDLRITDMRFSDVVGAPMHCTLMKLMTNQGIEGYGEIRDGASRTYALMLKDRILGENPCNVDKIFRRIKQFGGHARQAGGVCGVELALWDLAGKAHGIPVYQMLGGRFRDSIRMYCDTDVHGRNDGTAMGKALAGRMERGYTFLKMDLGIGLLLEEPGALSAPAGVLESLRAARQGSGMGEAGGSADTGSSSAGGGPSKAGGSSHTGGRQTRSGKDELAARLSRNRRYDLLNTAHPFTGIHITEHGLDLLDEYVTQVRGQIGYEVPLRHGPFRTYPAQRLH